MMKEFENRKKKKKTLVSLSKNLRITARNNWAQMLDGSIEDNSLELCIIHDHGGLSVPVEETPEEIIIYFIEYFFEAVDSNSHEKMQEVNVHKIANEPPTPNSKPAKSLGM
ncbi:uncharacterized protein LOC115887073 [Sitophilus oryzae]|uniref:Uncharacterized protein LOC115887073 n=1 Tax=Sitophilus oryzae TaxID=7048 RepID=A0A6J2YED2_SITOR|nr:uncharacterized protein LOC115887073 [Sitophilus oryzae]